MVTPPLHLFRLRYGPVAVGDCLKIPALRMLYLWYTLWVYFVLISAYHLPSPRKCTTTIIPDIIITKYIPFTLKVISVVLKSESKSELAQVMHNSIRNVLQFQIKIAKYCKYVISKTNMFFTQVALLWQALGRNEFIMSLPELWTSFWVQTIVHVLYLDVTKPPRVMSTICQDH